MNKNKNKLISVFMIFILVIIAGVTAFAADSASSTVKIYNYTYTYYSYINRWGSESIVARTSVFANESVPAGYIGIKARMYSENGALVASSDWSYNNSQIVGFDCPIYYDPNSNDTYYYSKGQVRFYNGNGYSTYTSNASPNLSLNSRIYNTNPVVDMQDFVININEYGEVYGSEIFLEEIGVEADLIFAIGENGVEGYVKSVDIDGDVATSPDDAIQQNRISRTIPLFKRDGKTIIGTFLIQNNNIITIQGDRL